MQLFLCVSRTATICSAVFSVRITIYHQKKTNGLGVKQRSSIIFIFVFGNSGEHMSLTIKHRPQVPSKYSGVKSASDSSTRARVVSFRHTDKFHNFTFHGK
jgi:hypothetical protein